MQNWLRFIVVLLLLVALFHVNATEKERLVIMSVDGLGWHELENYKKTGSLTKGALVQNELMIERLQVVATGNTGPSHITAYTGVEPKEGGWVGNTYLTNTNQQKSRQSAFTAINPDSDIQHVVTKIKNKGLSTACLNAPTINPELGCDLQISFSPRMEPSCGIMLSHGTKTLSCGSDKFLINSDHSKIAIKNSEVRLEEGFVASMCWTEDAKYYSRLMYKEKNTDGIQLYIGPKHVIKVNEGFHRDAKDFLCWPGLVDGNSIRLGKISQTGFYKVSMHQHDYSMRLLKHVLSMPGYDVVLGYTSLLDKVQHELLSEVIRDEQGNKINFVEEAFAVISDDLKSVIDMLDEKDSMLVFSDHGFQKSDAVIFINGFLRSLDMNIKSDTKSAQALVSGALGHLYTNQMSSEKKEQLKTALLNLKFNNKPVFNFVIEQDDENYTDFNHPNSGDIIVMVNPGFSLDPRMPPNERYIYPSMAKPDTKLRARLGDKEYLFLSKGTSNRVSPGVHGFNSDVADIDGIIFGTNKFQTLLKADSTDKKISDVSAIIENAANIMVP